MSRFAILTGLLVAVIPLAHASPALAPAQQARYRALQVRRVVPPPNALTVPATSSIVVVFDQVLDLSQTTTADFQVFGRWSGVSSGTYSLAGGGRVLRFTPDLPFSAGELVTVSLADRFRTKFGARMGRGLAWSFRVEARAGSRTFSQAGTYVPGHIPYGAYGGDIDEDGDLDLCVPNEGSMDVTVLLNNGAGFDPPTSVAVGRRASANRGADVNRDGHVDLVVANVDDNDVSVLLGRGDGTFAPQVRYPVGVNPRGLVVFDVDGDGGADLVTANVNSSDLSLLTNRGHGVFRPQIRFDAGVQSEKSLAAADMNLDGALDLIVVGLGDGNARTLLGDGRGNFQQLPARSIGSGPWTVEAGDVDADGRNDIAATLSTASTVVVVRNLGSGILGQPTPYATGFFPVAVDLGDLDGDGWLDMTATSFGAGTYHVWFNQGDGSMGSTLALPATLAGSCTVLHDLDGDGDVDITGIDEVADELHVFLQDG